MQFRLREGRIGYGQAWCLGLMAFIGGGLCGAAWISGVRAGDDEPVPTQISGQTDPTNSTNSPIPVDIASDPVFRELSKAFLRSNQAENEIRYSPSSTSDTVWHAIESALSTAKLLEAEEARLKAQGELEKASQIRDAINGIRMQGVKLLAAEMQITLS
ncbi:hypothetical protein SH449x_003702 [Pirellulaceae bacterium SH449]